MPYSLSMFLLRSQFRRLMSPTRQATMRQPSSTFSGREAFICTSMLDPQSRLQSPDLAPSLSNLSLAEPGTSLRPNLALDDDVQSTPLELYRVRLSALLPKLSDGTKELENRDYAGESAIVPSKQDDMETSQTQEVGNVSLLRSVLQNSAYSLQSLLRDLK